MKKLYKDIEIGEYKFRVCVNRDIAIQCAENFKDFFSKMFDNVKDKKEKLFNVANLKQDLEYADFLKQNSGDVVKFALPLMLNEADDTTDSEKLIKYIYDNDADEVFNAKMLEFIIMGFSPEEAKKPKVKIKI